jgi:hypothetical protein
MTKFDSYVLHIEQDTLDKLNQARDLTIEVRGRTLDFNKLVNMALGRYITAIKYEAKNKV